MTCNDSRKQNRSIYDESTIIGDVITFQMGPIFYKMPN